MTKTDNCINVETIFLQPRQPYELTGQQASELRWELIPPRTKSENQNPNSDEAFQAEETHSELV